MFYYLHAILPKRWLSQVMYGVSRIKQPVIARLLIRLFMFITGASLKYSKRKNIADYHSLNDFFTRELADNAREFSTDMTSLCSPVDGRIAQSNHIENDKLFAIKGHTYSLTELVGEKFASNYFNGESITIYLAPDDYHRIHAPETCKLNRALYIPGEYNSVSLSLLDKINGLFARNERVIYELTTSHYNFLMVFVGAVNVSSIETKAHGEIRHTWQDKRAKELLTNLNAYDKGEEMARFNLGSTVILIYPKKAVNLLPTYYKQRYWLGDTIGHRNTE